MIMGIYCVGTRSFGGVLPSLARVKQPKELVQHNIFPYAITYIIVLEPAARYINMLTGSQRLYCCIYD